MGICETPCDSLRLRVTMIAAVFLRVVFERMRRREKSKCSTGDEYRQSGRYCTTTCIHPRCTCRPALWVLTLTYVLVHPRGSRAVLVQSCIPSGARVTPAALTASNLSLNVSVAHGARILIVLHLSQSYWMKPDLRHLLFSFLFLSCRIPNVPIIRPFGPRWIPKSFISQSLRSQTGVFKLPRHDQGH
jgi:hypothetical protein